MATDSLLDRLPAELRLKIYALVLSTDTTPRRRITRRDDDEDEDKVTPLMPGLALLTVSRSVYNEALATLCEGNTLVIHRSELYLSKHSDNANALTPIGDLLIHLEMCETRRGPCSDDYGEPCDNCSDPHRLIEILTSLPRLRTIIIEYGAELLCHRQDRSTDFVVTTIRYGPFSDLRRALDEDEPSVALVGYRMDCARVGVYHLLGPSFGGKTVTFRDRQMSAAWSDFCTHRVSRDTGHRRQRRAAQEINSMFLRYSVYGELPLQIASIWPSEGYVSLRALDEIGAGESGLPGGVRFGAAGICGRRTA
ncbi:hypothetical protein LTR56_016545 [Elasticomyces elasticus]|nr:hypothetical protein LTR22_025323 [Elasticomyces elasticus]KAK3632059.1 hypothetical protein LTR56_016545 [Elasticomyces elasticus]KAK4931837.1 hypothetical protein LTR49_001905 [Elasticomyces elasticus]KAK5754691.1 hypothetical protein LTS12_015193 [Elasticomyces elasticus]